MEWGLEYYYPLIIRLLLKLVNNLTSVEYRECYSKFESVCSFMAHTLIRSIFNLFQQFARLAKNTHVIRATPTT